MRGSPKPKQRRTCSSASRRKGESKDAASEAISEDQRVLLADLVATSEEVSATRARSTKIAALADLLRRLDTDEVETAVACLAGSPRQGKIGVGWATLAGAGDGGAAVPTLTVADL